MADATAEHLHHGASGLFTRWFCSVNHKDIGLLYPVTAGLFGAVSVAMTGYMRLELMQPGMQYMVFEDGAL